MNKQSLLHMEELELATIESVVEGDADLLRAIVESIDPDRDDPLVTPWRRGHSIAIHEVLSH
jgi:hypothetical protein